MTDKRDRPKSALARPGDVAAALGLLTRLPVRVDTRAAMDRGARAAWAWPLAGLAVGGIAAAVATVALWVGLVPPIAAALALAVQVAATGAMHEDGLSDSLDGLWGGWTRERRLEIMKDSHIGVYGTAGLVLVLLVRWQALALLIGAGAVWAPLLALGAVSRAPMLVLMALLPGARPGGLSDGVGRPPRGTMVLGTGMAGLIGLGLLGVAGVPVLLAAAGVTALWGRIAMARIGGQTGDILGAAQQWAEVAGLLVLTAALV